MAIEGAAPLLPLAWLLLLAEWKYVPKVDNGKIRVVEGIETELTERSKMHYLDSDTFWAVLSDVWKRHTPTTGMTPKQLKESLSAQGALRDLNAVSVSRPASIRFLETRVGRRTHMKKIIEAQQARALFLGAQTNRGLRNGCVVRRTSMNSTRSSWKGYML